MSDPVHIPSETPDLQTWDDDRHGRAKFRLLVDASGGPSEGLVQGLVYLSPGDAENMHRHDLPETVHVIRGRGEARFDGRSLPLETGDTVFVPPGDLHGWAAPEGDLVLLFTFPADRLDEVAYHFAEAA